MTTVEPIIPSPFRRQFKTPESIHTDIRSDSPDMDDHALFPRNAGNVAVDKHVDRLIRNDLPGQEHVRSYLADMVRRDCRTSTIKNTFIVILAFLVFIKRIGTCQLETITRDTLCAFVENEQDRGLKSNTINSQLRSLHAFLQYLIDRDVIHPDVLKRKIRIKVPDALPRAIAPEDIRQLISAIHNIRDRAFILTLLRTGMRISELLHTTMDDLDLKEQRIIIYEARKTRTGRVVFIGSDACEALHRWIQKRDPSRRYLFYSYGDCPLSYSGAREIFCKYREKAGLAHKGYSLHCLRHTFASELLNAGMRLECLQVLLGHSSIEMTRRYARLTDNRRREEYFKAMAIIEKGEINGHYQCDLELPSVH